MGWVGVGVGWGMLTFPGNCVLTLMLRYAWGWCGVGHVNVPWQLPHHVDATFAKKVASRKKLGFVVTGTQCIDRWWQSLEKALPQSLRVKEKPGGGLGPKLMLYVWGFVWRSNLPNHANLTKELAAIMD